MLDLPKLTFFIKKDPSAYKSDFFNIYNDMYRTLASDSFWSILCANKTSNNTTKHFTAQFNFINSTINHYYKEDTSNITSMVDLLLDRLSAFSQTSSQDKQIKQFSFHCIPQNLANSILQFILIVLNYGNTNSKYLLKISSIFSSFPKKQRKRLIGYISTTIFKQKDDEAVGFIKEVNESIQNDRTNKKSEEGKFDNLNSKRKINKIKLLLSILKESDKKSNLNNRTTICETIIPLLLRMLIIEEDPNVLCLILKFFCDKKVNGVLNEQNLFNNSAKYFDDYSGSLLVQESFGNYIKNKHSTLTALVKKFKNSKISFFIKLALLYLIFKLYKQLKMNIEKEFFKHCFENYLKKYLMYPDTFAAICSVVSVCFNKHIKLSNYAFIFHNLVEDIVYRKNLNESPLYVLKMFKIALRNNEELKEDDKLKRDIISYKEVLIKESRKKKPKKNIVNPIVKLRNNIVREINTIVNVYKEGHIIEDSGDHEEYNPGYEHGHGQGNDDEETSN